MWSGSPAATEGPSSPQRRYALRQHSSTAPPRAPKTHSGARGTRAGGGAAAPDQGKRWWLRNPRCVPPGAPEPRGGPRPYSQARSRNAAHTPWFAALAGAHRTPGGRSDHAQKLRQPERRAQQEALDLGAPRRAQRRELRLRLDSLGHGRHVEAAGKPDDRPHDRGGGLLAGQIGHEGAVDLDLVEREIAQ